MVGAFLLDNNVERSLAGALSIGLDVQVYQVNKIKPMASDEEVVEMADDLGAVLISHDKHFCQFDHRLGRHVRIPKFGFLRLDYGNIPDVELTQVINQIKRLTQSLQTHKYWIISHDKPGRKINC